MSSFQVSQIRCWFRVVYRGCVFLVFSALSLACTSLSFESLRFVRKLGPIRWKLSRFCQDLLSESFLSDFWWSSCLWLIARITGEHQSCRHQLSSMSKDSNRKSLARKIFGWCVFNRVSCCHIAPRKFVGSPFQTVSYEDRSSVVFAFSSDVGHVEEGTISPRVTPRQSKHVWRASSEFIEICISGQRKDGSSHSRGWMLWSVEDNTYIRIRTSDQSVDISRSPY